MILYSEIIISIHLISLVIDTSYQVNSRFCLTKAYLLWSSHWVFNKPIKVWTNFIDIYFRLRLHLDPIRKKTKSYFFCTWTWKLFGKFCYFKKIMWLVFPKYLLSWSWEMLLIFYSFWHSAVNLYGQNDSRNLGYLCCRLNIYVNPWNSYA